MTDSFQSSSNRDGQKPIDIKYNDPWEQVNSSATAWNNFVAGLGLRFQHWAFTPYVLGATDTGSLRNYDEQRVKKSDDKTVYDNNGMYRYMGDVFVIWQSNSKREAQLPPGYYPDSIATITLNRHYIDTTEIIGLSEYDKFILVLRPEDDPLEFATVNWEGYQHNPTGIDRLMFKAVRVDYISDANGVEYIDGKDFVVSEGNIKWLPNGTRPGFDNASSEGVIMSVRYRYIPSFYIKNATHELRSHSTVNPNTGTKTAVRMPMTASVQIDWVFLQSLKNQEKGGDSSKNVGTGGNMGSR